MTFGGGTEDDELDEDDEVDGAGDEEVDVLLGIRSLGAGLEVVEEELVGAELELLVLAEVLADRSGLFELLALLLLGRLEGGA